MSVCRLQSTFLALCTLEMALTAERQVFDFLGYMWTPILANFLNILFLIFGCFGAVQRVPKYLLAYVTWSVVWLAWNCFLICFFLNVGVLNRESDMLSLGTGSVSWWEANGWGCRPVWGADDASDDAGGAWLRPARVDGCLLPWPRVELAQAVVSVTLTATSFAPGVLLTMRARKGPKSNEKDSAPRRPIYTIELSPTAAAVSESALKPMTPRRVKRRSGSHARSSVRRSRRSYRNAGYTASTSSLPRNPRPPRPASAHSSYSNFHGARPASYHAPEARQDAEPSPEYEPQRVAVSPGYDVAGSFDPKRGYGYDSRFETQDNRSYDARSYETTPAFESTPRLDTTEAYGQHYTAGYPVGEVSGWEAVPPPAPPYCARATPQAPGPPAYRAEPDGYM